MKEYDTDETCPFCERALSLTTEWGWIDADTCTVILCCPHCRVESDLAGRTVQGLHCSQAPEETREETETRAISQVLAIGLPD